MGLDFNKLFWYLFALTLAFLGLYYWVGTKEIAGATFGGINNLIGTLQGQKLAGRGLPTAYPK